MTWRADIQRGREVDVTADKRTFILLVRQVPQPMEGFPQYTMATTTITTVAAAREAEQLLFPPASAWLDVELGRSSFDFAENEPGQRAEGESGDGYGDGSGGGIENEWRGEGEGDGLVWFGDWRGADVV